jgi:arylsulfatase A-like enzyme
MLHLARIVVAHSAVLSMAGVPVAAAEKPNVILFLVDDMGWMDCTPYGSEYYETPHMQRFAATAMRFTDAYALPLCSPTRASLLSGQYSARHGVTSASGHQPPQPEDDSLIPEKAAPNRAFIYRESRNYLRPSQYTLAECLRDAGWKTGHFGKWHLGLTQPYWPEQQGFDVAFHCHPDPGPPSYFSPYGVTRDGMPGGRNKVGTVTDGPQGEYIVDRVTDEAIRFIKANKDRPFFANVWQYGVHGPWGHKEAYTREFFDKRDPRGHQGNPIMASMLRSVDESLGRILDTLDELKLTDRTIVIFMSDNGGNTHSNTPEDRKTAAKAAGPRAAQLADWQKWAGDKPPTNNAPLRDGKGRMYEGGTRVPLMIRWPGVVKGGATNAEIVGAIDIYPTLLDMLGLAKPAQQTIDGVSMVPALRQIGRVPRDAYFTYFPHLVPGISVRQGDWKLIRRFEPHPDYPTLRELFNLRDDLGETTNLAEKMPQKVQELDALIDRFLAETGAPAPEPNPAYRAPVANTKPAGDAKTADGADPLEGWKARQCTATVKEGIVSIVATGKRGGVFLGHAMGRETGPAVLTFRVRSPSGGAGKVEWVKPAKGDDEAKTAPPAESKPFDVPAGEWREISVEITEKGPLGVVRLYLPAGEKPLELDWIELAKPQARAKPTRWEF